MPNHAQLPLWDDKSATEKLNTLHKLTMDLYQYQLQTVREQFLVMLDAHQTDDDKEQRDIATIKQLLHTHPNIINMNCEVGHITASAIIVDTTSYRVLLHFHKRLKRWLQVGGHPDYETDMSQVALREATEETGLTDLSFFLTQDQRVPIDYDVHTIPQNKSYPEHLHLDFRYILTTNQPDSLAPESGESTQFQWLTFKEALAMGEKIDYSLRRLIQKTRQFMKDKADP